MSEEDFDAVIRVNLKGCFLASVPPGCAVGAAVAHGGVRHYGWVPVLAQFSPSPHVPI